MGEPRPGAGGAPQRSAWTPRVEGEQEPPSPSGGVRKSSVSGMRVGAPPVAGAVPPGRGEVAQGPPGSETGPTGARIGRCRLVRPLACPWKPPLTGFRSCWLGRRWRGLWDEAAGPSPWKFQVGAGDAARKTSCPDLGAAGSRGRRARPVCSPSRLCPVTGKETDPWVRDAHGPQIPAERVVTQGWSHSSGAPVRGEPRLSLCAGSAGPRPEPDAAPGQPGPGPAGTGRCGASASVCRAVRSRAWSRRVPSPGGPSWPLPTCGQHWGRFGPPGGFCSEQTRRSPESTE